MSIPTLVQLLQSARWLPPALSGVSAGEGAGNDLFEWLESIGNEWPPAVHSPRGKQRWQRLMAWVTAARARGAQLTLGVPPSDPGRNGERPMRLLPDRLVFWPPAIPGRPWTAIVTSRLGRRLDQWSGWFDYFNSAAAAIHGRGAVLLTAEGTASERFTRGAAQRLSLRRLPIRGPRRGENLHNWLARLPAGFSPGECPAPAEIWLSPPIAPGGHSQPGAEEPVPLRDEALFDLADELYAVRVRRGGNVERLIRACLLACPAQRARVYLPTHPQLVAPAGIVRLGRRSMARRRIAAYRAGISADTTGPRARFPRCRSPDVAACWSLVLFVAYDARDPWPLA
jgi:hypothetical protein